MLHAGAKLIVELVRPDDLNAAVSWGAATSHMQGLLGEIDLKLANAWVADLSSMQYEWPKMMD